MIGLCIEAWVLFIFYFNNFDFKNTDSIFSYNYIKATCLICILVHKVVYSKKNVLENRAFFKLWKSLSGNVFILPV